jgi:FkbM family methyltransferase
VFPLDAVALPHFDYLRLISWREGLRPLSVLHKMQRSFSYWIQIMPVLLNALVLGGRHTPLGRGKTRRLLLSLAERLTTGPIRTTYRGAPIILHLDNTTERKALFHAYDRREMEFLRGYLTDAASVFVDIGANSGLYTQWLSTQMQPSARIIAIEPNTILCSRIRQNLALLARKPQVRIECCAVGDGEHSGLLDLSHGLGCASLVSGRGVEVKVRPLLSILEDAGCERVSALKIDIEGYEDRAIVPFFQSAPREMWPGAIVIEFVHTQDWRQDALALLRQCGYREIGRTRANMLLALN